MKRRDFLKTAFTAGVSVGFSGVINKTQAATKLEPPPEYRKSAFTGDYLKVLTEKTKIWKKWKPFFDNSKLTDRMRPGHDLEVAVLSDNLLKHHRAMPNDQNSMMHPILWRTTTESIGPELFGYQSLMAPAGFVFAVEPREKEEWGFSGSHFCNGLKKSQIYSKATAARTKKYRARWSYEAAHDLQVIHGLDAKAELCVVLATELSLESDRAAITQVRTHAANQYFHHNTLLLGEFIEEKIVEQRNRFLDRGDKLHHHERYEWVVTSPQVIERLDEERCLTENIANPLTSLGITLRGWLRNNEARIRVYEDPLFPEGEILIGRKYSDIDAGFIIAPYLNYIQTPVSLDPESFCPSQNLMGRESQVLVNPFYYTRIVT